MAYEFDYILVGGGLQNALFTLALLHKDPNARILLVERAERLAGNHTWSMHESDIAASARSWIAPLIGNRWPRYRVRFPGRERVLELAYASMTSERVHKVLMERQRPKGLQILFGREAVDIAPNAVHLKDGTEYTAKVVVLSLGPEMAPSDTGYQKFFGIEVELDPPPSDDLPVLMDATVSQEDGYRFLYLLPLSQTRWLIEDTYFSDNADLDASKVRCRIAEYLDKRGWQVASVSREEQGVLPMPWRGPKIQVDSRGPLVGGYQGGWFHPATGYSAPVAIRWALAVADAYPHSPTDSLTTLARRHNQQANFARLLNRLLFRGFPPEARWNVFDRFYRLPEEVIARFYSLEMSRLDRARILCGRPPRGFSVAKFWSGARTRA